ncbi:hypothetical protein N9F34_01195 [Alphaproteobacteria bacterium]|nr:hypothetical protein [Alphaproteobacteria bacterium]
MTKYTNCHTLVETLWDRAQVALKERRPAEAFREAKAILVLLPSLSRSIMFCGMCLAPLGLPERALVMLNRAHAADPSDVLVMTRLSEALYADGQFAAAEIAVRNTLRGGVADGEGLFLLARTLWLQGSIDAAHVALDQAVKANSALQAKRNIMEYTVTPEDFL